MAQELSLVEIERRALALLERLSDHDDDEATRARLLADEDRTVVARVERIMATSVTLSQIPTHLPGSIARLALDPPLRFRAFRFVDLIGSGGMGEVWRGERDDGLYEQTVAIKLIQAHLQVRAGEAFESERRILARLEHPNIARLIDGGATDDGRACFVMEYVDGVTFDEACAGITPAARIALFRQALAAVHYAHGRLVAHGDLKPSNILVDREGRVRLLDFGIARLITEDAGDFRSAGAATSGFASPARVRGEPPSIPDDVFALGRLLRSAIAADGNAELVAIAEKASAVDEADRYAGVSDLAADIERFVHRKPVSAMPQTPAYVAGKWLRRHGKAVSAAIVVALALAYSGFSYVQAQHERDEAGARFDNARSEAHYLLFTLYDQLALQPNSLKLRRDVVTKAQYYLTLLANSPSTVPEVKLEAAQGLLRLAQVQGSPLLANLGQSDASRSNLNAAQALLKPLTGAEASRVETDVELESAYLAEMVEEDQVTAWRDIKAARVHIDADKGIASSVKQKYFIVLSTIERWNNQFPQARADALGAIALSPEDDQLDTLLMRSHAVELLADADDNMDDHAKAEAEYAQALSIDEKAVSLYPKSYYARRRLTRQLYDVGIMMVRWADARRGLTYIERAIRESRANVATEPDDDNGRRSLAINELGRAQALAKIGQGGAAIQQMQELASERKALWSRHPDELRRMRDYAFQMESLSDMQLQYRHVAAACQNYAESRRVFELIDKQGRLSVADRANQLGEIVKLQAKYCEGGPEGSAR